MILCQGPAIMALLRLWLGVQYGREDEGLGIIG